MSRNHCDYSEYRKHNNGPIATVLKTAAALVILVPDQGGSVLKAALSLGANALKPGPDIAAEKKLGS